MRLCHAPIHGRVVGVLSLAWRGGGAGCNSSGPLQAALAAVAAIHGACVFAVSPVVHNMSFRRVVVTGVGCVSPLGLSLKETWAGLLSNASGLKSIDAVADFYRGYDKDALALACRVAGPVPCGGSLAGNSRQSRATLFALAAAEEALHSARLELAGDGDGVSALQERTGVAVGTGMSSITDIADAAKALADGKANRVSPFFVPKILCNAAAGGISIKYKLRGPNHCASTACATGAHAIGDAFRLIQHGDADVMLCGGTESCLNPIAFVGFQRAKAMTVQHNDVPEEASRPFDAARAGFVMAEGAAVFVLEEYESAVARGAPVLAEVVGYGMSGDGYHVTSPHPESAGMKLCMQRALGEVSRVTGRDTAEITNSIGYLNAHATSTPMGDELEANAVDAIMRRTDGQRLPVSSTKGHVGHLLGAAGSFEAAVALQALVERKAPGTRNLQQPPASDLINFITEATVIDGDIVVSNSFGFGGTNTTLVFSRVADA